MKQALAACQTRASRVPRDQISPRSHSGGNQVRNLVADQDAAKCAPLERPRPPPIHPTWTEGRLFLAKNRGNLSIDDYATCRLTHLGLLPDAACARCRRRSVIGDQVNKIEHTKADRGWRQEKKARKRLARDPSHLLFRGHKSFPAIFLKDFVDTTRREGSFYVLLGRVHVERHRVER